MKVKYNQELFDWLYSLDYAYVWYHKDKNHWSFNFMKEDYKECDENNDNSFINFYSGCDGDLTISVYFNNSLNGQDVYILDMKPTKENITALLIAHGLFYNFY